MNKENKKRGRIKRKNREIRQSEMGEGRIEGGGSRVGPELIKE